MTVPNVGYVLCFCVIEMQIDITGSLENLSHNQIICDNTIEFFIKYYIIIFTATRNPLMRPSFLKSIRE